MRSLLVLLMLAAVALAGCSDDAPDDDMDDDMTDDVPEEEESTMEDFPNYVLDLETGLCHAKEYDEPVPGQLYTSTWNGGDGEQWVFQESNGVPGLQVSQNQIVPENPVASQDLGLDPRCTDGDQIIF